MSKERTKEKRERKGVLSLENGRVFEARARVFEASERKRGCLHVESAFFGAVGEAACAERGTERTKQKSGFEAGRQERRRRSL